MKLKLNEPALSEKIPSRFLKKISPSAADQRALAVTPVDPEILANDFHDYSKTVVKKPWGYEYLIFQNQEVSVWILHIKKNYRTSFHCHLHKKTSIAVLSGEVLCLTLEEAIVRRPGEGMWFAEKVFHRTQAISEDGVFILEIETPVNKRDIIRFQDDHGRQSRGYETSDHMTGNVQNYHYISLVDSKTYCNVTQRFGSCNVELVKCASSVEFQRVVSLCPWDTMSILKGPVINKQQSMFYQPGDLLLCEEMGKAFHWQIQDEVEVLLIRKIEV